MIEFTCRHCDRDISSSPVQSGALIACPYCGRRVVVPGSPLVVDPTAGLGPPFGAGLNPQTAWQRLWKIGLGVFMLVGATTLLVFNALTLIDYFDSASWPTTKAWIEKSDVQEKVVRAKGIPITSYLPAITYVYQIGTLAYRNTRVCFGTEYTLNEGTTKETAQRTAQRFPAGGVVSIVHHPSDPWNTVLERRVDPAVYWTIVSMLGFGLFAVRLLLVGLMPYALETTTRFRILTRRWHWADFVLLGMFCCCGVWQILGMPFLA